MSSSNNNNSGGSTPKFRRFRLKKDKQPDVAATPSAEELNTNHISSSSPPEIKSGKGLWDMSKIEGGAKSFESANGDEQPPSTNPFDSGFKKSSSQKQQQRLNGSVEPPMDDDDQEDGWAAAAVSRSSRPRQNSNNMEMTRSTHVKKTHIEKSAGTSRLNRILHQPSDHHISYVPEEETNSPELAQKYSPRKAKQESVSDPLNEAEVGQFVARVAVPQLRVDSRSIGGSIDTSNKKSHVMQQECLVSTRCKSFETTGADAISSTALENPAAYAKHKRSLGLGTKARNKFRYVMLVRSTNRSLEADDENDPNLVNGDHSIDDDDDDDESGYDGLFTPDANDNKETRTKAQKSSSDQSDEISSFPVLVCVALHSDGTNPDIRKLMELDQLTTVQNVETMGGGSTIVQLAFRDGSTVRIDFGVPETPGETSAAGMRKERFLWGLLQIHAMLCTSVVERNSLEARSVAPASSNRSNKLLQPLTIMNLDRADLQYIATVNGFLRDSPMLCALLDRQRIIGAPRDVMEHEEEEEKADVPVENMDGMAYDMMMGNYSTRVALFVSAEERADAEEVLNMTEWDSFHSKNDSAAVAAETISDLLQRRMRDLEAETCRRLIAWEDEKHYSLTGKVGLFSDNNVRDTSDALSLAALFTTLDTLDQQLGEMEEWLQGRAAVIKPLTDDCCEIEEENRQLEQNFKSCDMLGRELVGLLHGLDVPPNLQKVLNTPASALVYDTDTGNIDIDRSDEGVVLIHTAGMWLKEAMDKAKKAGGIHLRAVNESAEALSTTGEQYCAAVANIVATVMEQIAGEVIAGSDNGKVSKLDTNATIAKKVRDTQRKFQSALLGYMKLIEVLQQLKPKLLPAIRDAYSEMVAEGILMKKRMKGYFQALPGKNTAYMSTDSKNLSDYEPFENPGSREHTVNAPDIEAALSELLPVIAREAYFTAALFGLGGKDLDGREKKRNFESAKKSVDHSSQYFRYYISRTVGIATEADIERGVPPADPMLSLVASIYLNDVMANYIDREKKGGDHSLSLAYVRATIMDLRKKVDKQWVVWVEQEIEWIKSHEGVPLSGKRAGVFASFARFPSYLDHILLCVREGRPEEYTPDFASIKVVNYYLQKMANALLESLRECSERETTDQSYGANVMRMENTYFFTQSIKKLGPEFTTLFQKQLARASSQCKQSTDNYLGWMIKREFKELHALFSNISRIRRDVGDKDVPIHFPRATFVKTLSKESSREVMKDKIKVIYHRMEKHLSEGGGLLPVAWKALVKVLYEWFGRWEKLSSKCYHHVLEPSAVDIVRIAKATGGSSSSGKDGGGGGGGVGESRRQVTAPETPATRASTGNAAKKSVRKSSQR